MEAALMHFDGERYRLGKYVVAANHVHLIVTPLPGHELAEILHSWKSYTAKQILHVEAASRRLPSDTTTIWQK
jgi:REP element-mobilizing transposase RayT